MTESLIGLLRAIERGHVWLRPTLRNWLESHGPTPVERGRAELWMLRHAQRMARSRRDRWGIADGSRGGRLRAPQRRADAIAAWRNGTRLTGYPSELDHGRGFDLFDHYGSTTLGGYPALVSEVYAPVGDLVRLVPYLSRNAGLIVEATRASAWPGTSRLVWFSRPPARGGIVIDGAESKQEKFITPTGV